MCTALLEVMVQECYTTQCTYCELCRTHRGNSCLAVCVLILDESVVVSAAIGRWFHETNQDIIDGGPHASERHCPLNGSYKPHEHPDNVEDKIL